MVSRKNNQKRATGDARHLITKVSSASIARVTTHPGGTHAKHSGLFYIFAAVLLASMIGIGAAVAMGTLGPALGAALLLPFTIGSVGGMALSRLDDIKRVKLGVSGVDIETLSEAREQAKRAAAEANDVVAELRSFAVVISSVALDGLATTSRMGDHTDELTKYREQVRNELRRLGCSEKQVGNIGAPLERMWAWDRAGKVVSEALKCVAAKNGNRYDGEPAYDAAKGIMLVLCGKPFDAQPPGKFREALERLRIDSPEVEKALIEYERFHSKAEDRSN
jgi:hypothetical protein